MQIFGVELKMTVPNALSLLRILLVPVFAILYIKGEQNIKLEHLSYVVLAVSGLTDLLDGIIARKFNKITELGKILDPFADKLTQIVVVFCLATRMPEMVPLLIISVVKEVFQGIGGILLLYRGSEIDGARWFGKVSTFVFYSVMIALLIFKDMGGWLKLSLIGLVSVLMLFSFIRYMILFFTKKKEMPEESTYKDKIVTKENEKQENL